MPNWGQVLNEISTSKSVTAIDDVRRKYLGIMHQYTGRNVIAFYSGFLQKSGATSIDDNDMNALMQAVNGLDKSKGLDLLLHTPGGRISTAGSIVTYLRAVFGNDIRVFVPQIAMSAGTMIALAAKEIIMGKQSNIGPIDPQFGGTSCGGVIEEFECAKEEIKADPSTIPLWQVIISKYHATFIGDCQKAIIWADSMVKDWLKSNMLLNDPNKEAKAEAIAKALGSHKETYSHERHIHIDECRKIGIHVVPLESFEKKEIDCCVDLQDCVLTIHHAFMLSFSHSNAVKIVENHKGNAMIISNPQPQA